MNKVLFFLLGAYFFAFSQKVSAAAIVESPTSLAFGNVIVGFSSPVQVFSVSGTSLSAGSVTVAAPSNPCFGISLSPTGPFLNAPLTISYTAPTLVATPVYVAFIPTGYSVYTSSVTVTGGGAAATNEVLTGTGVYACSGTPSPGTASVTPSTGTAGPLVLSLPGATVGGLSYQWYSWALGTTGFSPISGATTATYSYGGAFTTNTYFYCVVTCNNSGLSATSNTVEATYTNANCSGLPATGSLYASTAVGCGPSYNSTVYDGGVSALAGISYNWEISTVGPTSGFTAITGANSPYYALNVTGTVWLRDSVKCATGGFRNSAATQLVLSPAPGAIVGTPLVCLGTPVNFTDPTSGGSWTSSNTSVANVNLIGGGVTGVAPGTVVISYTLGTTGCFSTSTVTVNNGPALITGSPTVCFGSTTTLSDLYAGGTWTSSSAHASVGSTTGVVTGVSAGTSTIYYTIYSGCSASYAVMVNPRPAPITATANNICAGGNTVLSDATSGGTWSSADAFTASVGASSGIVAGVAAGTTTITYTISTGCAREYTVTVNPLPAAIMGSVPVCAGQNITLTDGAGTWSSSSPALATVGSSTGVVTGVAGGAPIITYYAPVTGCRVTTPVTINPAPGPETVTVSDSGGYCPGGAGVHVGLSGSFTGVNYYLLYDTSSILDTLAILSGSTSSLDFGVFAGIGVYSVTAVNTSNGCGTNMNGIATVYTNTPPATHNVGGGGTFCQGAAGIDVTLDTSNVGVLYQLLYNGVPVGSALAGNGGGLDFGPQNGSPYPYTIEALNESTLCTSQMAGYAFEYPSVNPPVDTLLPGGSYCAGGPGVNICLSNSTGGVFYRLYNGSSEVDSAYGISGALCFTGQTMAGNYTVSATDITNGCNDQMYGSSTVTINPLPHIYSVTGGGAYCAGGAGEHVGVNYSETGVNYTLNTTASGYVTSVGGSNSGLDFGAQTTPGTYFVIASVASTSCSDTMTGMATVVENPTPTIHTLSASAGYCLGGAGVPVTTIDGSDAGINYKYQLYLNGTPVGSSVTGTGLNLNFGSQTAVGNYTVIAENMSTLCTSLMSGTAVVTIDSLPHIYTVSGGGAYCAGGAGSDIMLSNSDGGVTYQLIVGTDTLPGVGGVVGALDFGDQSLAGTYTVLATNGNSCTSNMASSASVVINPLPVAETVTGGGSYCAGSTGRPVGLLTSASGISYQLMNEGTPTGVTLSGTGSALNFGVITDTGHYTVVATNGSTSCTSSMSGTAVIAVNQLPNIYTVTGSGTFCAGSAGAPIGLTSSDLSGVTYELYMGSVPTATVTATGHAVTFGDFNLSGTYTVVGISSAGCTANMASSAVLSAVSIPNMYEVSGGGSFCAGDTGTHIFLSGSNTYVNYQVYNGFTPVGGFWAGTGSRLDLGLYTASGTYSVSATSATNGCMNNMADSAILTSIATVPASVSVSTGAFDTACAGSFTSFGATALNGGSSPTYQWKVNGSVTGYGSSFGYIPANGDVVTVTLTSSAACAVPAVASTSAAVTVLPTVTPAVSVAASANNVCPGTSVTFSATPTYGGDAPTYSWKVNGYSAGTPAATLTYIPNDSDVIFALLNSSERCLTSTTPVFSNDILETVDSPRVPIFNISINPVTPLLYGQTMTFSANVINGAGSTLSYQWSVNSIAITGATNSTYTSSTLKNNDIVCCAVTATNGTCGSSSPATECQTMVIYGNTGVANVQNGGADVKVLPNPNNGTFTINGTIGDLTANADVTLEVTNMLGQVVYSGKTVAQNGTINQEVELSNMANGMYLLNVRSGADIAVFHFVIEK